MMDAMMDFFHTEVYGIPLGLWEVIILLEFLIAYFIGEYIQWKRKH